MFRLIAIIAILIILLAGFVLADAILDHISGAHQSRLTQMGREVE